MAPACRPGGCQPLPASQPRKKAALASGPKSREETPKEGSKAATPSRPCDAQTSVRRTKRKRNFRIRPRSKRVAALSPRHAFESGFRISAFAKIGASCRSPMARDGARNRGSAVVVEREEQPSEEIR
ncbi:hypothetical protein DA075_23740 [Methylobacterium currus]|uniref:Uncharacterized protein n=1 Tax=Methylobacterium currus TaxID=2051553 RepID=A0A2R4WPP8_9HYPH|nr:hypothetical protein DA075_23740 [Methylobacterium currus]